VAGSADAVDAHGMTICSASAAVAVAAAARRNPTPSTNAIERNPHAADSMCEPIRCAMRSGMSKRSADAARGDFSRKLSMRALPRA
jgi:hypothetical protein